VYVISTFPRLDYVQEYHVTTRFPSRKPAKMNVLHWLSQLPQPSELEFEEIHLEKSPADNTEMWNKPFKPPSFRTPARQEPRQALMPRDDEIICIEATPSPPSSPKRRRLLVKDFPPPTEPATSILAKSQSKVNAPRKPLVSKEELQDRLAANAANAKVEAGPEGYYSVLWYVDLLSFF